jgi:hypothetical protein
VGQARVLLFPQGNMQPYWMDKLGKGTAITSVQKRVPSGRALMSTHQRHLHAARTSRHPTPLPRDAPRTSPLHRWVYAIGAKAAYPCLLCFLACLATIGRTNALLQLLALDAAVRR